MRTSESRWWAVKDSAAVDLETRDICLGYGEALVVSGVSVRAVAGKITAIVGPNGSGKSTLLKGIAGLLKPVSGSVLLNGDDVTGLGVHHLARRGLGLVPQQGAVFVDLTVAENLDIGAYTRRKGRKEQVESVCDLFPVLGTCMHRSAWTLSGGEQRMLAFGRALMSNPSVLLLDEPTVGLSPRNQAIVWDHILTIRDRRLAILVVEQNTRQALSRSELGFVLAFGEIKLVGTGQELLHHPDLSSLYLSGGAVSAT